MIKIRSENNIRKHLCLKMHISIGGIYERIIVILIMNHKVTLYNFSLYISRLN